MEELIYFALFWLVGTAIWLLHLKINYKEVDVAGLIISLSLGVCGYTLGLFLLIDYLEDNFKLSKFLNKKVF